MCLKRRSTILDDEGYFVSSADGLPDSLIEWIKCSPWMYQAIQAVVLTNQYTTVEPVVNSVPRFNHRAPARDGGVVANELLTLQERDDILTSRNKGIGIFERAADLVSINGQRTMSVLAFGK